jgi:hypothetical protein
VESRTRTGIVQLDFSWVLLLLIFFWVFSRPEWQEIDQELVPTLEAGLQLQRLPELVVMMTNKKIKMQRLRILMMIRISGV